MRSILKALIGNEKYCHLISNQGVSLALGKIKRITGEIVTVEESEEIDTHIEISMIGVVSTSFYPLVREEEVFSLEAVDEDDEGEEEVWG